MPIEDASIAQALKPLVGEGAERTLQPHRVGRGQAGEVDADRIVQRAASAAARRLPRVPITPQRRPTALSACAVHDAVEVLPLVPVTAHHVERGARLVEPQVGDLAGRALEPRH